MVNPRPKTTPKERLASLLKQSSSIPESSEFRAQCRDVYRLGGVVGLDEWIDARRKYGLIDNNKDVSKAADSLQWAIGSVIDEATKKPEKPKGLTWEQRLAAINKREEQSRNSVRFVGTKVKLSTAASMASAYDQIVGIDFASRGG